jgi:hypothetical protein
MTGRTLRAELEELRVELARLRKAAAGSEPDTAAMDAPGTEAPGAGLAGQIAELNRLVHHMLEDAEETITEHPAATVAGALALGIVIGRLTAR